jgi:hypothetical protein
MVILFFKFATFKIYIQNIFHIDYLKSKTIINYQFYFKMIVNMFYILFDMIY